jgi:hypothetical protein
MYIAYLPLIEMGSFTSSHLHDPQFSAAFRVNIQKFLHAFFTPLTTAGFAFILGPS